MAHTVCIRCGYPEYYEDRIEHPSTKRKYVFQMTKHIISNTERWTYNNGKFHDFDTVYGYKYSCPDLAVGLYSLLEVDEINHLGTRERYEALIYDLIDVINSEKSYPNCQEMVKRAKKYIKTIKNDYNINHNPKKSFIELYAGLKVLFETKMSEMTDQNAYVDQAKSLLSIESKTYSEETINDVETILRLTSTSYNRFK